MKKEEKAKVGRPKLADNDLKMNSIVLCMMSLVVVLSLMIGAMFSLTSLGTKNLKGAASNTFTVYYDLNGLKVKTDLKKQEIEYGKKTKLTKLKVKNDETTTYKFLGWIAKRANGTYYGWDKNNKLSWHDQSKIKKYKIYNNEATVSKTQVAGSYVTMYASWIKVAVSNIEQNTATVSWESKGFVKPEVKSHTLYLSDSSGNTETKKQKFGPYPVNEDSSKTYGPNSVKLNKNEYYKASVNYKFIDSKNGSTKDGFVVNILFKTKNDNFYIKFDGNGATSGTMSTQSIEHGVKTALYENNFKKTNATFIGWKAKRNSDGKVRGCTKTGKCEKPSWLDESKVVSPFIYNDKAKVYATVDPGLTVTMIAQWKEKSSGKVNAAETDKKPSSQTAVKGKFKVESTGNNCYKITAPEDANYWRVHVYYKKSDKLLFGTNKVKDLSRNHYNDNKSTDEVCFKKQKYDKETFRILLKVTDGAKDKTLGKPKDWRPSGWSYNSSIGWAYKDYKVSW